jgi:misacylated tRNA(Ala) deacylase
MEQEIQLNEHNKQEYPPMHTCEHIVNRTMVNLFGCGRAVSAHIERKKSKLDFALPSASEQEIQEIEAKVNEVISQHLDITTEFITQQEAVNRFDLKRLPENASETVRIVKVGDYDECLCIGAHVQNTAEIGTFKIISHDYKEGIFRMRFKLIQG